MGRPVVLVVAWESFQPRTLALGDALGGASSHIRGGWPGRHPALLPLRYLADGVRMWRMLRRQRPTSLVVISPPVIAPLVGWLWSLAHSTELVIDCHTGAFNCWKWRWTVPIHRVLFRRGQKAYLVEVGNRLMIVGMAFLTVGMTGIMVLISNVIFGTITAVVVGVATAVLLGGLWFVVPLNRCRQLRA